MNRTLEDIATYSVLGAVVGAIAFTKLDGTVFEIQEKIQIMNEVALKMGAVKYGVLFGVITANVVYGIGRIINHYGRK